MSLTLETLEKGHSFSPVLTNILQKSPVLTHTSDHSPYLYITKSDHTVVPQPSMLSHRLFHKKLK